MTQNTSGSVDSVSRKSCVATVEFQRRKITTQVEGLSPESARSMLDRALELKRFADEFGTRFESLPSGFFDGELVALGRDIRHVSKEFLMAMGPKLEVLIGVLQKKLERASTAVT